MNQLAIGVPERPSTPAAHGWLSGIRPFALEGGQRPARPELSAEGDDIVLAPPYARQSP